ncbi:TRAP transporter large permease [Kumtagia ephedrae]|jgi:tripartite ATP-independent transporter DctM subunit|uniref:TRAP transporter large permease protein n=1 Tax=Kumtagia ephedrae TaxID=2116701 RepID=A0A2P7RTV0_9HYPH|nr:TRAP transporter large permease [Mesorhizobium ephedrae]PSJ53602.1 C4-dicarboxylate ABC transporter permease [Mesorhizobium ephedrae]
MILYLAIFFAALIIGMPVALGLGMASLVYLLIEGHGHLLVAFPQRMIAGIDSFLLLTIPFFILAGNLMNAANLTGHIVRAAQFLVGRIKGGLAIVNVLANFMLSGPSGAATSEAAAVGGIMIPPMKRDGYDPAYAAALTATGSLLGPLIPPSLPLILFGVLTGTSIGDLFLAGIVPGLILGALLLVYALWKGHRENHPVAPPVPRGERWSILHAAIPAIVLPVFIVVGIRTGIFTPTEAAGVACIYALVTGLFVYRSLPWKKLKRSFYDTATMSSGVMLVVAMASMTGFVLGIESLPQKIAASILGMTENPVLLVILLNIVLLVLGLFLEPLAAMVLIMPVLNALAPTIGMDPVQMGVMVVLNLMIGMCTPPVGLVLFIVSSIARSPLQAVTRASLPMLGLCLLVLALVAAVPGISLWIPGLFK